MRRSEQRDTRVWLDEFDAMRYAGRSKRTLHRWRTDGTVTVGKKRGKWYFEKDSLREARRLAAMKYRDRRIVPGPGRGKKRSWPEDELPLFCL